MLGDVVKSVRTKFGLKETRPAIAGERFKNVDSETLDRMLIERLRGYDHGQSVVDNPGGFYGSSTAVHSAVRVLAEAVSRPKLEVWRTVGNGERVRVERTHPLQELLARPNKSWSTGHFLREIEGSLALWGVAYVAVSEVDGMANEMWPLRAENVRVVTDRGRELAGFIHEDGHGREAFLPEDVIWFRRYNPDNWYSGFSSLVPARIGVEMGDHALRYNRRFFLNSAMPSDVVVTNDGASEDELSRVMEDWDSRIYDPQLAHRPMILSTGIDMKRLGSNQNEMEFIGALEWSVEEVSRAFGVPKIFLSEYEDATLANVSVMEQFLWRNTVIPELRMLEEGLNAGLVPGFEVGGETLEIKFDLSDIEAVQESQSEKAERLVNLVQAGIMTSEEARAELGL